MKHRIPEQYEFRLYDFRLIYKSNNIKHDYPKTLSSNKSIFVFIEHV